jgi:glycine cleavage system H protein
MLSSWTTSASSATSLTLTAFTRLTIWASSPRSKWKRGAQTEGEGLIGALCFVPHLLAAKEGTKLAELRFPDELRYSPTHEWVRVEGNRAIIGITDYAQSELGDVTYLELPKVGDTVEAGQPFGVIESVKADEELFAPVSGTVVAVNQNAVDHPEIVNEDPYGEGWLIVVEMSDPDELKSLMTAQQYRQMLEREGAI